MEEPVILIANPVARRASPQKIRRAEELLKAAGHQVILRLTEKRGDAEEFARNSPDRSFLLAAGGDGTFNEVMNGIVNTGRKMAILPLGTTNVLAKELGVPENVEGAVAVALAGREHRISLGKITYSGSPSPVTRHFCLMAGIGFDGETVYRISSTVKKYWGKGSYVLSGLRVLAGYSPGELTFEVNGKSFTGYSAIIGKAPRYGGDFMITPDAKLANPELYAYIMHGKRRTDILRYALGVLRGSHIGLKTATYLRAESVRIQGKAHIQTDGDYLGTTPAEITVIPHAVRLICP